MRHRKASEHKRFIKKIDFVVVAVAGSIVRASVWLAVSPAKGSVHENFSMDCSLIAFGWICGQFLLLLLLLIYYFVPIRFRAIIKMKMLPNLFESKWYFCEFCDWFSLFVDVFFWCVTWTNIFIVIRILHSSQTNRKHETQFLMWKPEKERKSNNTHNFIDRISVGYLTTTQNPSKAKQSKQSDEIEIQTYQTNRNSSTIVHATISHLDLYHTKKKDRNDVVTVARVHFTMVKSKSQMGNNIKTDTINKCFQCYLMHVWNGSNSKAQHTHTRLLV